MYRIRSRFYKKEDMIFISHLDLVRLFERAFRRGNIPISYTQGYNPHPIMAFATALGVGVSSEGEYIDIEVEEKLDIEDFMDRLNHVLPQGLAIVESKYISRSESSLMSVIQYSTYIARVVLDEEVCSEALQEKLKTFLNLEEIIEIKEKKKKGNYKKSNRKQVQEINIRPYIQEMQIHTTEEKEIIFKMMLAAGSSGNLKPEIAVKKFGEIAELQMDFDKIRVHRLELLTQIQPQYLTPLDTIES
ncbi:radical SAM-linked protein [Clostridium aceticum]|uniref:Radical SAM-linked protein n=1 Tax=Clostridium aceticum TaxID=84022 RepID=A0A0G3WB17_9CLOT|nr:TIGR03936 family radical SAM-associated protein [Clostridium aceticum]AKL95102.1 radical SAM-linked protein [Clostridium aceticum]